MVFVKLELVNVNVNCNDMYGFSLEEETLLCFLIVLFVRVMVGEHLQACASVHTLLGRYRQSIKEII